MQKISASALRIVGETHKVEPEYEKSVLTIIDSNCYSKVCTASCAAFIKNDANVGLQLCETKQKKVGKFSLSDGLSLSYT